MVNEWIPIRKNVRNLGTEKVFGIMDEIKLHNLWAMSNGSRNSILINNSKTK
jgi:hypothetical protein